MIARVLCWFGWHAHEFELEYGALRCRRCGNVVGVVTIDRTPTYGDRARKL